MVMVPTLAMTFGNLIAGIFGMNLSANAEWWNTDGGFFWCVMSIGMAAVLIIAVLQYLVHRSRTFYQAHGAKFGNNRFFKEVGKDEYILSLFTKLNNPNGDIRVAVDEDLREPALPVRRESSRVISFQRTPQVVDRAVANTKALGKEGRTKSPQAQDGNCLTPKSWICADTEGAIVSSRSAPLLQEG